MLFLFYCNIFLVFIIYVKSMAESEHKFRRAQIRNNMVQIENYVNLFVSICNFQGYIFNFEKRMRTKLKIM